MNRFFEIREHHLEIECPQYLLDIVSEIIQLLIIGFGVVDQVINQQRFVYRGGHLGYENRVMRRGVGLCPARIIAMHGVPHLVSYREHLLVSVVVVEQHIWMSDI